MLLVSGRQIFNAQPTLHGSPFGAVNDPSIIAMEAVEDGDMMKDVKRM